jgi:Zn finger protein HypA/HybF involved in hydrogenase expression
MHEMGLAQEICRIAREKVGTDACPHVLSVGLEVGNQAGVEADNLMFWLEVLLSEPPFGRASPVLHRCEGDTLQVTYLELEDGDSNH